MNIAWIFQQWTSGDFDETGTLTMGSNNGGMAETHLTQKDGGSYTHAYISETCTEDGDEVLCGVNEDEGSAPSIQFIGANTVEVVVGLRSTGGTAHSAGVIWLW
ncbi:MAG TPA: hypothetical protein VLG16_02400 [Candidatus Saccharimonadales bacterium]|nr:hypothetical protein [Candidatus Saccharimonadales bacterium]